MRQMQKVRRNSKIMSDSYCRFAVGKLDPTETFAVKSAMGSPVNPIQSRHVHFAYFLRTEVKKTGFT